MKPRPGSADHLANTHLPPGRRVDYRLAALALVTVAVARVGLWLGRFPRTRAAVLRLVGRDETGRMPDVATISLYVRRTARLVPAASCLAQAIACEALLRRYGYTCELSIGAGKDARGRFQAHAWLVHDGRIVIGDFEDGMFETLATLKERT